ncbi:hypothetical protein LTR93_011583 [Exophiala xenobiotica]|nr:hypothetical protein LTR93_011583 [Exophiala xenobiotica]
MTSILDENLEDWRNMLDDWNGDDDDHESPNTSNVARMRGKYYGTKYIIWRPAVHYALLQAGGCLPAGALCVATFGVPYIAMFFTWAFGLLAFLNVSNSGATVFGWFVNISTISGFAAWIIVMIIYIRFRKAVEYNQMFHVLPYKTPLQPYATWCMLGVITNLTLTNRFQIFFPKEWNASDFLAAYTTILIFLVLYLGHKTFYRTPFLIPIPSIDVITGKQEMDELEAMDRPPIPRNALEKAWFGLLDCPAKNVPYFDSQYTEVCPAEMMLRV